MMAVIASFLPQIAPRSSPKTIPRFSPKAIPRSSPRFSPKANKDDLKNRNFNKVWMYWDCC